ncbi:hypothetical protein AMYX_05590 [Anaeromyxobacter diazotrophicus]|uniref:Uncharacterized protein n=1 Tax=Anaeromyxobacter diazotrophicus TaxID=2590199 RepID=A0A7I9VI65_9BACT|nr:hypothetical protein AMYX_05590 [Anaeromyxobacter diazotrophicus]
MLGTTCRADPAAGAETLSGLHRNVPRRPGARGTGAGAAPAVQRAVRWAEIFRRSPALRRRATPPPPIASGADRASENSVI